MSKGMYRSVRALLLVAAVLMLSGTAAAAGRGRPSQPGQGGPPVSLPDQAVEVAPGVFYLGTALEKGRVVEGFAFLRYGKGFGKPSGCNDDGACQGWEDADCTDCVGGGNGESSPCYVFLWEDGPIWPHPEDYVVNPANPDGLSDSFIMENMALNVGKWEAAAGPDMEIIGAGDYTTDALVADTKQPDEVNEVYFGSIRGRGRNAIAMTIIWRLTGIPELIEWDQVYNTGYPWSDSGESGKMDFQNIATHELGHSVGLGDLYTEECTDQTMYGYADYGETNKQTLEAGDIAGIQELY